LNKKFRPRFISAETQSPVLSDCYIVEAENTILTYPKASLSSLEKPDATAKERMNLLYLCSPHAEKESEQGNLKWLGIDSHSYCSISKPVFKSRTPTLRTVTVNHNQNSSPTLRTVTVNNNHNSSPTCPLKTPIPIRVTPGIIPTQVMSINVTTSSGSSPSEPLPDFTSKGLKRSFSQVTTTTINILYAEDNLTCRNITTRMAKLAGFQCDTVQDGLECCKKIEENPQQYHLILMDILMPGMDGIDATERIRQLGYNIPIFAVSQVESKEIIQRCTTAGMNGFLPKPLTVSKLKELLSQQNVNV